MASIPYSVVISKSIETYYASNSTISGQSIQLSRGDFRGEIELLELDNLWVVRRSSSQMVCQEGEIPKDQIAIGFVIGRRPFIGANGVAFYEGELAASWESRVYQHVVPANTMFFGIRFTKDLLVEVKSEQQCQFTKQLLISRTPKKFMVGNKVFALQENIQSMIGLLKEDKLPNPAIFRAERESLIKLLLDCLTPECLCTVRANSRARVFQRSLRLMLNTPASEIVLDNIAQQLGTSRRNLEQTYAEKIGISPLEVANSVRLNIARKEILKGLPADTVGKIARRCGFNHMGKFSSNYCSMFGELPSMTLRRQRESVRGAHPIKSPITEW